MKHTHLGCFYRRDGPTPLFELPEDLFSRNFKVHSSAGTFDFFFRNNWSSILTETEVKLEWKLILNHHRLKTSSNTWKSLGFQSFWYEIIKNIDSEKKKWTRKKSQLFSVFFLGRIHFWHFYQILDFVTSHEIFT